MKNHLLPKILLFSAVIAVACFISFCFGAQFAVVQSTNGQLMMNLQISRFLRDGDVSIALEQSESFAAANVYVLRNYDSPAGVLKVIGGIPEMMFNRDTLLSDYRPGAAQYLSEYTNTKYWPEVVSYLNAHYNNEPTK